jgi:cytochrome c peroxidase
VNHHVKSLATLALLGFAGLAWAETPADIDQDKPARKLQLPETLYRYADVTLPAHFNTPAARRFDNTPADNRLTDAGATLGRVLFYDTKLSGSNNTACASCHQQKNAFVDPNRYSKGHQSKLTDRHAPSLVELRFYPRGRFFWDERASSLENQVLLPIQSKLEMGQELPKLMTVLAADENYAKLYEKAFGTSAITPDRTAKALAQFVRSLVSYQSKYDEGLAEARGIVRADFDNFTNQENRGKILFLDRCANCHLTGGQSAHFFMDRPRNNGLDADVKRTDGGVGDLTLNPAQVGLFKSPSLRNVEFTAPYMHDGRFKTLEDVIEHYTRGIKNHPNLDGRLRRPLNISAAEKSSLVAFLKTLSDQKFISDPKFSDPFK